MAKILVVDDNTSERRLLSRIVNSIGHDCLQASSGVTALEVAYSRKPDLILLDLTTQESGGANTLAFLSGNNLTRPIPVIIVSGKADPQYVLAAISAGASDYIDKPVSANDLKLVLNFNLPSEDSTALDLRMAS